MSDNAAIFVLCMVTQYQDELIPGHRERAEEAEREREREQDD